MSHLLSFLEQYSHLQQLQQQADQYRVQLKRHRVQHRRQMKALRASYRQRLRDKNSIISGLEEAISQQQTPSPLSEGEEERREGGMEGGARGKKGLGEGRLRCKMDGFSFTGGEGRVRGHRAHVMITHGYSTRAHTGQRRCRE